MRRLVILCLAIGCGSKSGGGTVDGPGGGDGSAGGDGSNGGVTDVTVTIANPPSAPATFSYVVAFEDGSGTWANAPAPAGLVYTLPIHGATYGVAYTCVSQAGTAEVTLAELATAEVPSLSITLPARCTDTAQPTTSRLSGTIANAPNTGTLVLLAGRRTLPVLAGKYAVNLVPGTYDIFVAHLPPGGSAGATPIPDAILAKRGVVIGATDQTLALDFATAAATQVFDVTIPSPPQNGTIANTTTLISAGTTFDLVAQGAGNGTPPPPAFQTAALATAQQVATDLYAQRVVVTASGASGEVSTFTATPGALTYDAPTALGGAIATVPVTTPYPEVATTWSLYGNAIGYTVDLRQNCAGGGGGGGPGCIRWSAAISATAAGGSPAFQMPDLSALTGWDSKLQLATGTVVDGTVTAETSTAGPTDFVAALPAAGTVRTFASAIFTASP